MNEYQKMYQIKLTTAEEVARKTIKDNSVFLMPMHYGNSASMVEAVGKHITLNFS